MKIKITILPMPIMCSYFYAWTDNESEQYIYKRGNYEIRTTQIKFLHNGISESIQNVSGNISDQQGQDGDFSITFISSVNFNDFCHKLDMSEFNKPVKYHILNHNCAHGVMYALEQTGIYLTQVPSYQIFNRIDSIGLYRVPFFSFSPFDLYDYVKKYKIASIRESKEVSEFNIYRNKLTLWQAPSNIKNVKTIVTDIVKEVEKKQYAQEEHTKKYTDLLMQVYQFITHSPLPMGNLNLKDISRHYKQREEYHYEKWFFTVFFLATWMNVASRYMIGESQFMLFSKNPILKMTEVATIGCGLFGLLKTFNHRVNLHTSLRPTPLSKKIEELNEAMSAATLNTDVSCSRLKL